MIPIFYDQALVAEYANYFKKMTLPKPALPVNLQVHFFDVVDHDNATHNILTERHHHSFFEIHLVLAGNAAYECGGRRIDLSPRQALFIPPQAEHRYLSSSADYVKCAIAFSLDSADLEMLQIKDLCTAVFPFSEEVSRDLDFILRQHSVNNLFTPHLILGRIVEILYALCCSFRISFPDNPQKENDPRFLVAKAFIDKNRHKLLTCEDVAKECCLSSKQLGRIIYAATGLSLSQYITAAKLEQAKALLTEQTHSMKEICFLLGFENESSFTLFFKRHCGMPPSAYRIQMSEKLNPMSDIAIVSPPKDTL